MSKPRVIFRADGNHHSGYGHVIRSLSLASMIMEKFDCTLSSVDPDSFIQREVSKVGSFIPLDKETHFEEFLEKIMAYDIVVLDGYHFDTAYQAEIKNRNKPLIFIADLADKKYVSDVLINHAPGLRLDDFQVENYTKVCFGLDYALVRPSFRTLNIRKQTGNSIFICFGGADKYNVTAKVVELIQNLVKEKINVVVGSGYRFRDELYDISDPLKVKIFNAIDAEKMKKLIDASKLAVVPASTVLFEVLSRGVATISGYYVNNQINIYKGFKQESLIYPYGDFCDLDHFQTFFKSIYDQLTDGYQRKTMDFEKVRFNYIELFNNLLANA